MLKKILLFLLFASFLILGFTYFYSTNLEFRSLIQEGFRLSSNITFDIDYKHRLLLFGSDHCREDKSTKYCIESLFRNGFYSDKGKFQFTFEYGLFLDTITKYYLEFLDEVRTGIQIFLYDLGYYYDHYINYKKYTIKRGVGSFEEEFFIFGRVFNITKQNLYDFIEPNKLTFSLLLQLGESPILALTLFKDYLIMISKAWISALWLLIYILNDQLVVELFMVGVVLNCMTFITKETVYQGFKLTGTDIKYWAFSRVWNHITDLGVFDILHSCFSVMISLRIFLNVIGLPYLFRIDTVYIFIIAIIYCFYVVLSSFQKTVRYYVELKVEANVNVKSDEKVVSRFSLKDHFGFFLISSFWLTVPFLMRVYRKGVEFRPFRDLQCPNKYLYWFSLLSLPLFVVVSIVTDFFINVFGWLTIYIWVYPYLFNKRMSEIRWNALMESVDSRSSIIHSEIFNDRDGYMYNLIRSYLVWLGWYRPDTEYVFEESQLMLFIRDIRNGFPEEGRKYCMRKYKLPWRYLQKHKLRSNFTPDEVCEIFVGGLRADAIRVYGFFPNAELLLFSKGLKNAPALFNAEQLLNSECLKKFGVRYIRSEEFSVPDIDDEVVDVKLPSGEHYFIIDRIYGQNDSLEPAMSKNMPDVNLEEIKGQACNYVDSRIDLYWPKPRDLIAGQLFGREYCITYESIDLKNIHAVPGLSVIWSFPRLLEVDSDYSRTVCYINSLLSGVDLTKAIEDALICDDPSNPKLQDYGTDEDKTRYLIKDGYNRLKFMLDEDISLDPEEIDLDKEIENIRNESDRTIIDDKGKEPDYKPIVVDNKPVKLRIPLSDFEQDELSLQAKKPLVTLKNKAWLPEYRDWSVFEYAEIAKILAKHTGYTGSIITQLGHVKKFGSYFNVSIRQLLERYDAQINEWALLPLCPMLQWGLLLGQGAIKHDDIVLILKCLKLDNEVYPTVINWLETFEKSEFPRAMFWFMEHNISFMQRFISVDTLSVLISDYNFRGRSFINSISPVETKQLRISDLSHFYKNFDNPIKKFTNWLYGSQYTQDDEYFEMDDFKLKEDKFKYSYENMSRVIIKETRETSSLKGLHLVGRQNEYHSPNVLIKFNSDMANSLNSIKSGLPMDTYIVVNPTQELILKGLEKYKRKNFSVMLDQEYNGVVLREWLFSNLDYFYRVNRGTSIRIRPIESFSLEDLSEQSRKASAGFLSGREGIRTKSMRMDFAKEWALAYRKSILTDNPLEHIWMSIPIGKSCKPSDKEIRMVNAPEMYFYINQYLQMLPFVTWSKASRVTNNFSVFFGEFDKCVRRFVSSDMKESLDLKSMGGSIQREIKDLFVSWYGRFFSDNNDIRVMRHIMNDIFGSTFMIPSNYGGYVFKKEDGWCDGPYGTGDFDTWAMVVYYLINCWYNMRFNNLPLSRFEPDKIHIESHGDNWLHSYPIEDRYIYRWDPSNLKEVGQAVKGNITVSSDMIGLELMGFYVCMHNGLYVGRRPLAKTIKSLIYNKKFYKDSVKQASYIKGIILSLLTTDCWDQDAYSLLSYLMAQYSNVEPYVVDIETANRVYLLTSLSFNPRDAWTYEAKNIRESEPDPLNLDSWGAEDKSI